MSPSSFGVGPVMLRAASAASGTGVVPIPSAVASRPRGGRPRRAANPAATITAGEPGVSTGAGARATTPMVFGPGTAACRRSSASTAPPSAESAPASRMPETAAGDMPTIGPPLRASMRRRRGSSGASLRAPSAASAARCRATADREAKRGGTVSTTRMSRPPPRGGNGRWRRTPRRARRRRAAAAGCGPLPQPPRAISGWPGTAPSPCAPPFPAGRERLVRPETTATIRRHGAERADPCSASPVFGFRDGP